MFDKLRNVFRVLKESRSWNAILSVHPRGPTWMGHDYQAYAREGYIWNADVYACVNASLRAMRGFDFKVGQVKGTGIKEITSGPLYDLVRHPNPRQSFSALAGEWYGSMEWSGNAYVEGVSLDGRDVNIITRPPRELYILRPDRMLVVPGDAICPIAGFEYRAGSVVESYIAQMWRDPQTGGLRPRIPVMHSKYWHPLDDFYGLSPIAAASRNIDSSNSAIAWNVNLTQHSARPSGVFTTEQPLTTQEAQAWTTSIRSLFSGPGNAGRPMVLGAGLSWTQLGLTPADMEWLKGLEWNTAKICAIFGLAPEIIGDSGSRTYANVGEARKGAYLEKWLPAADMFCTDLNTWLCPLFSARAGEEFIIYVDREAVEAIQIDRQIKWANAKDGAGFLMVNEQRALLGYDPIPEGDVVMVPVQVVPLSISIKQKPTQLLGQQPPSKDPPQIAPGTPEPGAEVTPKPAAGKKSSLDELDSLFAETQEKLDSLHL